MHSEAWLSRCRTQVEGALGALEQHCAARAGHDWLVGEAMTHADIAVACFTTHLREALPLDLSPWPALRARVDRCEALPVFRDHYIPFEENVRIKNELFERLIADPEGYIARLTGAAKPGRRFDPGQVVARVSNLVRRRWNAAGRRAAVAAR